VTQSPIDFDVNRVCTHIFNTEEEIDRLVEALRRRGARA
jgi:selenocysteine lyase/cysteine desulfurase